VAKNEFATSINFPPEPPNPPKVPTMSMSTPHLPVLPPIVSRLGKWHSNDLVTEFRK
jgi:hypothetical protein